MKILYITSKNIRKNKNFIIIICESDSATDINELDIQIDEASNLFDTQGIIMVPMVRKIHTIEYKGLAYYSPTAINFLCDKKKFL